MSIESELKLHEHRTEPVAEIKPLKRYAGKEGRHPQQEKNFLKRLSEAIVQLRQRDDLQGFHFVIEPHGGGGVVVVMYDQGGQSVARLTPDHCFEMAERRHTEGLLVEIEC